MINRWSARDSGTWKTEYAEGAYRLTLQRRDPGVAPHAPLSTILSPTGRIPNDALTIEAKVSFDSPSSALSAGLSCRGKSNDYNGYRGIVRGDGAGAIFRFDTAGQSGKVLAETSSGRSSPRRWPEAARTRSASTAWACVRAGHLGALRQRLQVGTGTG